MITFDRVNKAYHGRKLTNHVLHDAQLRDPPRAIAGDLRRERRGKSTVCG